jgi:hypothetical protein
VDNAEYVHILWTRRMDPHVSTFILREMAAVLLTTGILF